MCNLAGNVTCVAGGECHSLAHCKNYGLYAWGDNSRGQLGSGKSSRQCSLPVYIDLPMVGKVAAGAWHSLALVSGGYLHTWGSNEYGQLGDNSMTSQLAPTAPVLDRVVDMAAGEWHSMAICSDGGLYTWGRSKDGLLGIGERQKHQLEPVLVPVKTVLAVAKKACKKAARAEMAMALQARKLAEANTTGLSSTAKDTDSITPMTPETASTDLEPKRDQDEDESNDEDEDEQDASDKEDEEEGDEEEWISMLMNPENTKDQAASPATPSRKVPKRERDASSWWTSDIEKVATEAGLPKVTGNSMHDGFVGEGPIWVVVGGASSGGIIVKRGKSLKSAELKFRLVYGARLEQLQLVGDRLHYKRVQGDGPDYGWVSLSYKGMPLLVKVPDEVKQKMYSLPAQWELTPLRLDRLGSDREVGDPSRQRLETRWVWKRFRDVLGLLHSRDDLRQELLADEVVVQDDKCWPVINLHSRDAVKKYAPELREISIEAFGMDITGGIEHGTSESFFAAGILSPMGTLVGFITFIKQETPRGRDLVMHVNHVAVVPRQRRRGHCYRLLQYVQAKAREKQVPWVKAECRRHNLNYYLRLGFQVLWPSRKAKQIDILKHPDFLFELRFDVEQDLLGPLDRKLKREKDLISRTTIMPDAWPHGHSPAGGESPIMI